MWFAKLKLMHDCIIGNRCKKYQCKSVGYPLESYKKDGYIFFMHFEKLIGSKKNISKFVNDLKRDKNTVNLEVNGNLLFFSYKTKNIRRMPSNVHLRKVMFVKPVVVDEEGYETWEITSWDRDILNKFIEQIKRNAYGLKYIQIQMLIQTDLNDVYFAKIMPRISKEQSRAISLAIESGYYEYPRKVQLKDLANKLGVSLSTYREHLRRAEKKVIPLLI